VRSIPTVPVKPTDPVNRPLGFDLEWDIATRRGAENRTALAQICDEKTVLLVHIARMRCESSLISQFNDMTDSVSSAFPPALKALIEDPTRIKLGVQIAGSSPLVLLHRLTTDGYDQVMQGSSIATSSTFPLVSSSSTTSPAQSIPRTSSADPATSSRSRNCAHSTPANISPRILASAVESGQVLSETRKNTVSLVLLIPHGRLTRIVQTLPTTSTPPFKSTSASSSSQTRPSTSRPSSVPT
jgi:hypothetical protein